MEFRRLGKRKKANPQRGIFLVILLIIIVYLWMNAESIAKTLETGQVTYWSRSRQEFWVKGATSGHTQALVDFRVDCDRDCLLVEVKQEGPACHTGRRTCFYTAVRNGEEIEIEKPMAL